mgnify:CR=1 FL=1
MTFTCYAAVPRIFLHFVWGWNNLNCDTIHELAVSPAVEREIR